MESGGGGNHKRPPPHSSSTSGSGGADTPLRPPPPPPTAVCRVGGGFEYVCAEPYTEALEEQAAYDTYRALPPSGGGHTATDVALLANILQAAEAELDAAGAAGQQQATLSQVLRAYQHVLRSAGLDPEADTHFYRALLRLSLDREEGCWWGRLYREITGNCRRHGASPEQQQMLLNVLLRCRMGNGIVDPPEEQTDAAEWAQSVAQACQPGSAAAGTGPPPSPFWDETMAAAVSQLRPVPGQLQQQHESKAAASPPVKQQAACRSLQQQALLAWQQASVKAGTRQAGHGKGTQTPIEDAVCSRRRPGLAEQPSMPMQAAAPPPTVPLRVQPIWEHQAPSIPTDTCTWRSPTSTKSLSTYLDIEALPWRPWLLQAQHSSSQTSPQLKYPPIHYHTPEAQGSPAPGSTLPFDCCSMPGDWPESPRILACQPHSATAVLPQATAQGPAPAAAVLLAAPRRANTPEQQEVLQECWGAWCILTRAMCAAQRAADLRGTAQAEEFREAQLTRLSFDAWRHHWLAVTAEVLGRMGSTAQRRSFLKWRAAMHAGQELDRRAYLHYNSCALRAVLKAWRLGAMRIKVKILKGIAALQHWQGRSLGGSFAAWRCVAAGAARRAGAADVHFWCTTQRNLLTHWRQQARWQTLLARVGAALARKSAGILLRANLQAWLATTQRRCEWRRKVGRCAAHMVQRQLADALLTWHDWAAAQQAKNQRAAACLHRMLHWRLLVAWNAWSSRVTIRVEKQAWLERCATLISRGTLSRCWRTWRDTVQLQLQKAARLQAVLTHMRGAHIIAALRGWRQAAARAKQLRGKAGVVLARWQHLQLSTAWASWCEAHSQQLAKQQVLRGAVSRLQQGAVARCFLHWREAVGRKARLRSMGERVLLRLGQLALGRAWNQWRAYAASKAPRRTAVEGFQPRRHALACIGCLRAWHTAAAEEARMRAVVLRLRSGTAVRALQAWHAQLAECRSRAARLAAAAAAWHNCKLRCAWASWLTHVRARQRRHALLQHATQAMLSLRLRAGWAEWQAFVAERCKAASKLEDAVRLWQSSHLLKAFRSWRERHTARKVGGIKLSRALARWRISSLSAAWQAWAAFVDDRCAKKAELAAAVGRLVNVRIAAAWASWQQAAERQRCKAEMLHAAAGFWFNHRLAAAFSMWQEHAQTRMVQRAKLSAAIAFFGNHTLAAALLGWREVSTHQAAIRAKLAAALGKLQQQRLWGAWCSWAQFVGWQRRKQELLACCMAHWQQSAVAKAWQAWRLGAADQRAKVAKLLLAAKRWHQPLLAEAFAEWAEQARRQRALASRLQMALAHWLHNMLLSAFNQWRCQVWQGKAALKAAAFFQGHTASKAFQTWRGHCTYRRELQAAAVQRWRSLPLTSAFEAWLDSVQRRAYQHKVLAAAATRLHHREVSAAWAGWRQYTSERREMTGKLASAVRLWQHATLRAAWAGWREGAAHLKAKQQRLAAAVALWQRRWLRAAWAGWAAHHVFQQHAHSVLSRFMHQALARALHSWRAAVAQRAQLASKLAAAVERWQNHMLVAAFAAWRETLIRLQLRRQNLQAAVERWMQTSLSTAVSQWRDAAAQQRGQRRALARFTHSALSRGWASWRWQVEEQAQRRLQLQRAVDWWSRGALGTAFAQWLAFAFRKGQRRSMLESCLRKLASRQQLAALNQWRGCMQYRRAKEHADAHYVGRLLAVSLAAFKQPLVLRPVAEACLRRLLHRQLGASFAAWRSHLVASHETAAAAASKGRAAVLRMQRALLSAAWNSWQQHTAHIKSLRRVLLRVQQRHALAALHSWWDWAAHMQRVRQLLRRHLASTALWALHQWREAAAAAAEERWALETVAAAEGRGRTTPKKLLFALRGDADLALLMHCFSAWRDVAATQAHLRAQVLLAYRQLYFSLARRCVAVLRYHALRQRRLQAAASRFTHSTMCKAWAAWRCHAQHKQSNAAKLQAAAGLWAGNTLALCWHRWRALVASVRQCRAASGAAAALYRLQLQRRALLTLWLNRLCRCEQRFVAFQAIGHMQGFRAECLFAGWRAAATQQAALRHAAQQLAARTSTGRLRRLIYLWRWYTARQRYLQQVVRSFKLRQMGQYLRVWHEAARSFARLRAISGLAASRHEAHTAHQVISAWRHQVSVQHRHNSMLVAATAHLQQRALWSGFISWRLLTTVRQAQRARVAAVLRRMQHFRQALALAFWRDAAAVMASKRQLATRAVQLFLGSALRRAFDTWRCNVSEGRAEASAAKQHDSLLQLRAFLAWEAAARQRRSLLVKGQMVVRQMQQRCLASAWRAWRAHAQAGADMRHSAALLVASLHQRRERAAFNAWAAHNLRKRAAALLVQQALGGRAERSVGACLATWHAAATESRRQRQLLQHALGRLIQRQMSLAFAAWRDATAAKHRQRQLVAGAVSKLGGLYTGSCFCSWQQRAANKRRLAGISASMAMQLHHRRLSICTAAWRMVAHRQATATRCLAAIRLRLARAAFLTWQAATDDALAEAAAAALTPQVLRRRFAAWRTVLLLAQQKQQRLEKAAAWAFGSRRAWRLPLSGRRAVRSASQHFAASMLHRIWGAWAELVARRQRLLVKEQHLQQLGARRLLATKLHNWQQAARSSAFVRRYYCARAWATWAENAADAKAKREVLRRALNLLSNGQATRCFTAWRSLASCMVLKRAAYARKQQAIRNAVAVGDAIRRQCHRELVVACWTAWRGHTCISGLVQERLAACLRSSVRCCWQRWAVNHRAQVQKQQRAEQALKRYKNALQQRAVASWRAGLAEAAEERRQKVEVAAAFARSEVLLQAWLQWMDWVDLQCLRRERLAALFSSLDGGDSRQMRPCWQRWSRAAEQGRRQAARAGELAGRHEAALLQAVLDTWSSYVRAMRADADPDSPFASPRDPSADSELIWDVAGLLAVAPVSSTDSGSGNGSSIAGHTCITVAAPAEVADIPSLAAAMATDAESEAGEANVRHLLRRWRLRNLFGRQR